MTWHHRAVSGARLHPGASIDSCPECSPQVLVPIHHEKEDHHTFSESTWLPDGMCYCGESSNAGIHQPPPCGWCFSTGELGAVAPRWHRLWTRMLRRTP